MKMQLCDSIPSIIGTKYVYGGKVTGADDVAKTNSYAMAELTDSWKCIIEYGSKGAGMDKL